MFPLIFDYETRKYYPDYSVEELEVHHIVPVSWAIRVLKWQPHIYNSPRNLILLDSRNHRRVIHEPTLHMYFAKVCGDTETFEREKIEISNKIHLRQKFWNYRYDNDLRSISVFRTEEFINQGNPWPQ